MIPCSKVVQLKVPSSCLLAKAPTRWPKRQCVEKIFFTAELFQQ
jgi:hypothetical protein